MWNFLLITNVGMKTNENTSKNNSVVSLRLHARLDDMEEARLSRLLKEKIERYGKVRVLLMLENYPAADTAESLYEDMNFLKFHSDNIERLAVVGDRIWQETWIALFGLFGGLETAYFDNSEMEKAAKWVGEKGS